MKYLANPFRDNAMFYKDITQWLRNRTFGSLFFGLLMVAEALSLFIIAGSDDMTNPGVSMFYTLFMVLIIYALVIAYLGNGLTSREFVNRTFELFELSGMSLERMVGGKVLSMLYQFFFGFFCLVPFMFFAYFLGGLDFFEMIVGVWLIGVFSVPLYLFSLVTAFTGRFKQIALLSRLFAMFFLAMFIIYTLMAFFSSEPMMQPIVRELTIFFKGLFNGEPFSLLIFLAFVAVYVQVCLLMFYFCCDSISRETDSREIPIKVLAATLIVSWVALFGVYFEARGYQKDDCGNMAWPIFLALLILGVRCYYGRPGVPPIVTRRYRDAGLFRRLLFALFKPGIQGAVRTIFFLIILAILTGQIIVSTFSLFSGRGSAPDEWWNAMSLLAQIPWFLAVPHVFYARAKNMRFNYSAQRSIAVSVWVVLGSLVIVYMAWTRSSVYMSGGTSSNMADLVDVVIITLLSPLPSMSVVSSSDFTVEQAGSALRFFSGLVGAVLMYSHMRRAMKDEIALANETRVLPESEPNLPIQNDLETMPGLPDTDATKALD